MKETRKISGLQIVCLALCLAILFNGIILSFPFTLLRSSPIRQSPTSFPDQSFPNTQVPFQSNNFQPSENQSTLFAELGWMQQDLWQNWNSQTELTLNLNLGRLHREMLHFSNIRPKPFQIVVEDFNPANSPFEDYIWGDEESYMAFTVNGTEPVRVNGFWIYLRGESTGVFRYRVYRAQPGTLADTFVNTSGPITSWIPVPITPELAPGEERWFWIDTDENTLVLDPTSTYANTFYFGLERSPYFPETLVNWVYCRDDMNPDEADEGDCYGRFSSWSYRTRDLFLNVSILPEDSLLYPSDIDLRVNNKQVQNLGAPLYGLWESDEYQPPLSFNGNAHKHQITVTWPEYYQWAIEFDLRWVGVFTNFVPVMSQLISGYGDANCLLSITIDFPIGTENQSIVFELHPDWVIQFLTCDTIVYSNWVVEDSTLIINNAEEGFWEIYCTIPISTPPITSGFFFLIAIILIIVFSAFFLYRQQILLPAQRRRRHHLQALADSFYDIHKIKRILLVHKETGLCLVDPILDRKMRANLVSALIQAITTFGLSLTEAEESDQPFDATSSLRQITYHDFHIMVHDGQFMRNALIFSQPPSSQLDERLKEFTARFEEEFHDVLENWGGRLNIFEESISLIDKYLFISLRLPHTLDIGPGRRILGSSAERELCSLAEKRLQNNDSFLIRDLVDEYLSKKGVQQFEVFEALFTLREKRVFVPVQTDLPYELGNNNTS